MLLSVFLSVLIHLNGSRCTTHVYTRSIEMRLALRGIMQVAFEAGIFLQASLKHIDMNVVHLRIRTIQ